MHRRKETLTSRERVRLALQHQTTDRIPIAMVCSGINQPADQAFDQFLRQTRGLDLRTYLHSIIDIAAVEPAYVGPPLASGEDMWGVQRKAHSYGQGAYDEIISYPLAHAQSISDLKQHRWPSTGWFDYQSLQDRIEHAQIEQAPCFMIHNANIFETAWYMRGFEQIFIDLVTQPEFTYALLTYVSDFYMQHFRKILEAAGGQVDLAFTADDIGGQNGLLISLKTWEKFLKPFHQQMNQMIHEFGVKVIYHSDGAVAKAVPGLIDMGIDVLQALQFSAKGMDPQDLKDRYGDRLCFEGGVSVQTTLPVGSVEQVRHETVELMRILGKNGGYILGPSHAIQVGTPPENIYTMFETALNEYPYA